MVLVNVSISWPNGISVDYEVRLPLGRTVLPWGRAGSVLVPRVPAAGAAGGTAALPGAGRDVQGGHLLNPGDFLLAVVGEGALAPPWCTTPSLTGMLAAGREALLV